MCIRDRDGSSPRNLEEWRSWIAYVPQKVELFKGSIRSNLTLGLDQEVTDQELWQALEIAQDVYKRQGLDALINSTRPILTKETSRLIQRKLSR